MGNWTILIMKLGCDFTKGDGIFLIYGNTYSLDLYMELLQCSKHKTKKMKTSNLRKQNTILNEDNRKTNYVSCLKIVIVKIVVPSGTRMPVTNWGTGLCFAHPGPPLCPPNFPPIPLNYEFNSGEEDPFGSLGQKPISL